MDPLVRHEIIKQAVERYGDRAQLRKCQEELCELSVAISHYLDGRENSLGRVREEVADVWVMIEQCFVIFGDFLVMREVDYKVERLAKRMEKGE